MGPRRVLIVYHSLTGRTQAVVRRFESALREAGHTVELARLEPVEPWEFPLSRSRFLWRNAVCWAGVEMHMPVKPVDLHGPYDHVVLATQTWHLYPAFPVSTWLKTDEAEILRGTRVTPVITCRNRWRINLETLTRLILQRGGQVAGAYVLSDPPAHLLSTLHYLFNGADPNAESFFYGRTGRPFDFSPEDLATADAFARQLAADLTQGTVLVPAPPVVVNDQEA